MESAVPLVEPIAVQEVFVDGIVHISTVSGNVKFIAYSLQRSAYSGEWERVVVGRYAMPVHEGNEAALQMLAANDAQLVFAITH